MGETPLVQCLLAHLKPPSLTVEAWVAWLISDKASDDEIVKEAIRLTAIPLGFGLDGSSDEDDSFGLQNPSIRPALNLLRRDLEAEPESIIFKVSIKLATIFAKYQPPNSRLPEVEWVTSEAVAASNLITATFLELLNPSTLSKSQFNWDLTVSNLLCFQIHKTLMTLHENNVEIKSALYDEWIYSLTQATALAQRFSRKNPLTIGEWKTGIQETMSASEDPLCRDVFVQAYSALNLNEEFLEKAYQFTSRAIEMNVENGLRNNNSKAG